MGEMLKVGRGRWCLTSEATQVSLPFSSLLQNKRRHWYQKKGRYKYERHKLYHFRIRLE